MQVFYRNGIHLPASDLWLDPHHARDFAVVSHAHADHMKGHMGVLCTRATAAMMRLRGARRVEFQTPDFSEKTSFGDAQISLFPAGHVLGSSQVLVEHDGARLLYSGDFKLRASLSAEKIEIPRADIVVMETTFGMPRYKFPSREKVMDDIIAWCEKTLEAGSTPVLLCYSLGKGQEVLAGLKDANFPIALHSKHFEMANLYRAFGVELPEYSLYEPRSALEGVLLCASGCRKGAWFQNLPLIQTAYISGWALDRSARFRFGTDAAFALSDHADYDELLEYVYATGAQKIFTTHGFEREFAADLRGLGFDAAPLREYSLNTDSTPKHTARRGDKEAERQLALGF